MRLIRNRAGEQWLLVQGDWGLLRLLQRLCGGNQAGTLGLWAIVFKRIMINRPIGGEFSGMGPIILVNGHEIRINLTRSKT